MNELSGAARAILAARRPIQPVGRVPEERFPERPEIPEGQPTWARVRHGGGCSLPRARRRGVVETTVPIRLERVFGDPFDHDPDAPERWRVPADQWSPGDSVEIGPLPANTIVEYEVPRPHHAFLVNVDPAAEPEYTAYPSEVG